MANVAVRGITVWGAWTTSSPSAMGKAYYIEGAGADGDIPARVSSADGTTMGKAYYIVGAGADGDIPADFAIQSCPNVIPGPDGAIVLLANPPWTPIFGIPS